jgi:tripartite-type tricarboxylate transporter receptor subunit TctC
MVSNTCRGFCAVALTLVVSAPVLSAGARAETWPARPIRAVVPFTPGSGTDIIARSTMEQLAAQLGQTIVIENRVGAGGTVGAAAVAKADPDGYTLLVDSSAHTSTPFVYRNLPYDAVKDFAAVAPIANLPQVLVISPHQGIRSVRELVAAAKANPGRMTYASGGTGSATHLSVERFRLAAGFDAIHVPFKGGPEALTEVMTGRVDFYFVPVLPALPFIRDGRLLPLAVSSRVRAAALPDVPTTLEAGFPDSDYDFWVAIFAPAATPPAILDRLRRDSTAAVDGAALRAKLAQFGAEPMPMRPAEFDAYLANELALNEKLVKTLGLAAN